MIDHIYPFLVEISAIEKLLLQGFKPIPVEITDPKIRAAKEKAQLKYVVQADDKIQALLSVYPEQNQELELITEIINNLKAKYLPSEEKPEPPKPENYPEGAKYPGVYNEVRYAELLPLCKLAYLLEHNGIPEEHAFKLSMMFDDTLQAIDYLISFTKQKADLSKKESKGKSKQEQEALKLEKSKKAFNLHNACLFGVPSASCDFVTWKKLARVHLMDDDFRQILGSAEDIQNLIRDNQPKPPVFDDGTKPENIHNAIKALNEQIRKTEDDIKSEMLQFKKLSSDEKSKNEAEHHLRCSGYNKQLLALRQQRYRLNPQYDPILIKLHTDELQELNTKYREKARNQNTRGMSTAQKLAAKMALQEDKQRVSEKRCEIFQLSAGLELKDYSMTQLMTCVEYRKQQNFDEVTKYLVDHGLNQKAVSEFNLLISQDDDNQIPNIKIDGDQLGFKGVYLMKVPVTDPLHAARAACFGKLTGCCQSLGDAGSACAAHGLTSLDGGFYVICEGDINDPKVSDTVLGQCWTWRSQSNAMVFDSIETNSQNNEAVQSLFTHLALTLIRNGNTDKVACGADSGISHKFGIQPLISLNEYPIEYKGYRDSHSQRVIYDKNIPFYFYHKYPEAKAETDRFLHKIFAHKTPLSDNFELCMMLNSCILDQQEELLSSIKAISQQYHREEEADLMISQIRAYFNNAYSTADILSNSRLHYLIPLINTQHNTLLMDLVDFQNAEYIRTLLQLKSVPYFIDVPNYHGITPLISATMNQHTDIVKQLLEAGANCNIKDAQGNTALMKALQSQSTQMALYLLENAPDINVDMDNDDGNHPVMIAAQYGMFDVLKKLIEKNAILNEINQWDKTALDFAMSGPSDQCVIELLKYTDADYKDANNNNLLMMALSAYKPEIAIHILDQFPQTDVTVRNDFNKTGLHLAAAIGNIPLITKLLNTKIDINSVDDANNTPLMDAVIRGNQEVALLLIKHGADYTIPDSLLSVALTNTPLIAEKMLQDERLELSDDILAAAFDVAIKNKQSDFALAILKKMKVPKEKLDKKSLYNCAELELTEVALALAKLGFDPAEQFVDKQGSYSTRRRFTETTYKTTLDVVMYNPELYQPLLDIHYKRLANEGMLKRQERLSKQPTEYPKIDMRRERSEILDELALYGLENINEYAIKDKVSNGQTYLMFFAQLEGKPEAIDILLQLGDDINAVSNGQTALMIAIQHNRTEYALELIKRGANLSHTNKSTYQLDEQGDCALTIALKQFNSDVAIELLEAGADPNTVFPSHYKMELDQAPALFYAINHSLTDVAKLLIDKGADIHQIFHENSPMACAIAKDQTDVAVKLFKAGAALEEKDLEKASPELKQALMKAKQKRETKLSTEPTSKKRPLTFISKENINPKQTTVSDASMNMDKPKAPKYK